MKVKPHQHNHIMLKAGIWLSAICLVHCLTFPLIVAVLPFFKVAFEVSHWVEAVLVLSTAVIGTYSLWHGYKLHHHKILPLVIFFIGLLLMIISHVFHTHDGGILKVLGEISGALLIAGALFLNLRLTKTHACTTAH
jgi:hypothetical protein